MITLGGHETMASVQEIWRSIDITPHWSASKLNDGTITNLLSILKCHTLGYELHRFLLPIRDKTHLDKEIDQVECNDSPNYPSEEIEKWGVTFQYLLQSLLYVV